MTSLIGQVCTRRPYPPIWEKLDGWRAVWYRGILWSKSGNYLDAPWEFKKNLPKDTSLDGELVLCDGRPTTASRVQSAVQSGQWSRLAFRPFDRVGMVFEAALKTLSELDTLNPVDWKDVESTEEAQRILAEVQERGGEGLMARRPGSHYAPGQSWALLKLK